MVIGTNRNMVALTVGPIILTGRHFNALDRLERGAVLSHEKAHIVYHHGAKRLWRLLTFRWKDLALLCQMQEYEADRYATMNGHGPGLIQFLSRPTKPHDSPLPATLHPTHDERIANIKRWLEGR